MNETYRLCLAPMMEYTDVFGRYFLRLFSKKLRLYTEMITVDSLLYGNCEKLLAYHEAEHPVALQLGGSEPSKLAACAKLATQRGFDEINLNVGCPSDRVYAGQFGACLMKTPHLVANAITALRQNAELPVTIKCRLGVDDLDSYPYLKSFIAICHAAGCSTFIIHARKAWLSGLSPKQNREIPPLDYERVYQLKKDFPNLSIIINGGITSLTASLMHLAKVDGVMIGRAAFQNPQLLLHADEKLFNEKSRDISLFAILDRYFAFLNSMENYTSSQTQMLKPLFHLLHGKPNAKLFRQTITDAVQKKWSLADIHYRLQIILEDSYNQLEKANLLTTDSSIEA